MVSVRHEFLVYCRDCLGEGGAELHLLASIRAFPSELPYVSAFRRVQSAEHKRSLELIAESSSDWGTSRYLLRARLLWSSTPSSVHGAVHFSGLTHYIDVMPLACERGHHLILNPEVVSNLIKIGRERDTGKVYLGGTLRPKAPMPCATPPGDTLNALTIPLRFRESQVLSKS